MDELARRIAKQTGGQDGQSDYFVFKLGSLFTHNSPGSLFLQLPPDRETMEWNNSVRPSTMPAIRACVSFFTRLLCVSSILLEWPAIP